LCISVCRSEYCRMSLPGLSPTAALPFDVNNTIGALLIGGLLATAYVNCSTPLKVSNWHRNQSMGNYMCTGDDAALMEMEYCPTYIETVCRCLYFFNTKVTILWEPNYLYVDWPDVLFCLLTRTFSAGCISLVSLATDRLTVMSSSGLHSGAWTPSTRPLIFIFFIIISSATSWTL